MWNRKITHTHVCIYISAVKQLTAINRIQNKNNCLHNICMCSVYIYVCINIHTYSIYFGNIYMYIHLYFYIINKYLISKHNIFFLNILMHVCIYIYIINIHCVHILCKQ